MKKLILATASAIALFGIAACSDSGSDTTTTQSVNPSAQEPQPIAPAPQAVPGDDGTGAMKPADPAPTEPAPVQ